MKKLTVVVSALLVLTACSSPKSPDPLVTDPTDGGLGEEAFDAPGGYAVPACASACATLKRLTCPESLSRPGEDSCYVVCKRAETSGKIDFKLSCVSAAKTRAALLSCGTYRCLASDAGAR